MNDPMSIVKREYVDEISLPCRTCDGDCCGVSTPFSDKEIVVIKKKYKSKFKKITIEQREDVPGMNILKTKGKELSLLDKCVFYDKKVGCTVYECRPEICRDFGVKKYAQCPFNGLEEMPASKETQKELTIQSQKKSFEHMLSKRKEMMEAAK